MKGKLHSLFILLVFLAGNRQAAAQGSRFFRVYGPTAITITGVEPDGTVDWCGAQPVAVYTFQQIVTLNGVQSSWADYGEVIASDDCNSTKIVDFNAPPGMTFIPGGVFTMGDTLDGESDALATNVTVSAFYMDVNLVSYGPWLAIYSYATNHGYGFASAGSGKGGNYPVTGVDWYEAVKWSNARSQQAGLTPVYYADAGLTHVYTNGDFPTTVYPNRSAKGYRLPTEAEWEKAARGGLSGLRFPWGNTISWSQANYDGDPEPYYYDLAPFAGYDPAFTNGSPYTSPVGTFVANGYGANDMAGNLEEWCWDWYGTPYGQPTADNPTGPAAGSNRVLRGGGWGLNAYYARCAGRYGYAAPNIHDLLFGFRCVKNY